MSWHRVCAVTDILPDTGVAALIDECQIALFRIGDAVHAIGNRDPFSGAHVLARGIVGDLNGELVVASPIYKQHFNLVTGQCIEDPHQSVPAYLSRILDGQVWVQQEAVRPRRPAGRVRLVVIGNGMAAMRTLEELQELAPQAHEVTVFGAEPRTCYNRVLLSPLLAGEKRVEDIITHSADWYREQGIRLLTDDPVMEIDRVRRRVRSRAGVEVAYDRLLIATGSVPVRLAVPGSELEGVMTFRDLQDVDAMLAAARTHRRAVVIGGGLLGLEAASGLQRRGMQVTVVHVTATLMNRQLDAHAAELLQRELERRGLSFRLGCRTQSLAGEQRVQGVQLDNGEQLPADLVVLAVGVRPNIALARQAGLRCDRGILVDDTLLTYDPAIYAVGECVQHRDSTYGLVAPLWEQARVCAAHLAERGVRCYGGSRLSTQLKVSGIDVFSAGDYSEQGDSESLVLRDPQRGVYKRLVIENNRIRGAVLYGDTRDGTWYFDLINERRDIAGMREQLLFGAAAGTAA